MGTELLLGQIVDTNSAWIGEQLALAGIDSFFQTKVGDNPARIRSALELALGRSDAVIVCGGLGPTQDDVTREVIAEVMGVDLVLDGAVEERIRTMFHQRGHEMPANNLRQAFVPRGATPIPEQPGTAPGLICPIGASGEAGGAGAGGKVLYAVPGVPYEMEAMVAGTVIPDLRRRSGATAVIRSRVLRTWGTSESGLAELLSPRISELDQGGRCTLAFLASGINGLKVRVTAKASTEAEADAVLADEVDLLVDLLGDVVFSTDDESMEAVVVSLLGERGLTLGTAESVTGGLVASRLTEAPGASEVLRGAVVAYASDVKWSVLDVPVGPVVSASAAEAMAAGACQVLGCDVAVSVTGVAGPARQEDMPVGTVFLGLCIDGATRSQLLRLPGDRERVRQFAAISSLDMVRRAILAR